MPDTTPVAPDPLAYELPPDLKADVEAAIIEVVKASVRQNAGRDQELYQLRQQLEGVSQPTNDGPYANSCMIQDPTPFEFHSTVHSNVEAAFRQKPWVTLEALRVQDDQVVQKLETMGNVEAELFGFGKTLSTLTYNALEGRYAVCEITYDSVETRRQEAIDLPVGVEDGGELITEPLQIEDQQVTESFRFEAVEGWDFYLNPVAAVRVQDADHTVRRVWHTRSSLMDGIANEGFDPEQVTKLIKAGPTAVPEGDTNPRDQQLSLMGVSEETPAYYECFRVVGRMPYLFDADGKPRIPDEFLGKDFLWMVCPAASSGRVFKSTFSPYPVRPYATGKAIGSENELYGHGVVSALSAISDEMTILSRAFIDSTNLTMNPEMLVPEHLQGYYAQKDKRQPGGILPYRGNDPGTVQALRRDFGGLQLSLELYQMLYQRCAQLVAAQGVNTSMGGKQRKAAEVNFMEEVLKNKFGLILSNLQRMVEDCFRIYFALRKHHTQSSVNVRHGQQDVEVSKQELDVPFRIIPHADADNASSTQRRENDKLLVEFLMNNPIFQARFQSGDWSGMWMLASRVLGHISIRNPEAFIGPPPSAGTPDTILMQMMPIIQQGLQQNDPVAQALAQLIQQARQQAQQGGGGQQGDVTPGSGLNMPAIPNSPGGSMAQLTANGAGNYAA